MLKVPFLAYLQEVFFRQHRRMAREEMKVERVDAAVGKTPMGTEGGLDQSSTTPVEKRITVQLQVVYSRRRIWRQRRLREHQARVERRNARRSGRCDRRAQQHGAAIAVATAGGWRRLRGVALVRVRRRRPPRALVAAARCYIDAFRASRLATRAWV